MNAAPRPTRWPLIAIVLLAAPVAAWAQPPGGDPVLQLDSLRNMLLVVWSSALMLLAAMAFPQTPLRWSAPIKDAAEARLRPRAYRRRAAR